MLKTTAIVLALALGASAFTPAQRPINARVRALRAEEGEETAAAPAPAPAPAAPAKKEESPYASPKGANFDKKTTGFSYGALILLLRQPAHEDHSKVLVAVVLEKIQGSWQARKSQTLWPNAQSQRPLHQAPLES